MAESVEFSKLSIDDLNKLIGKAQKEINKKEKAKIQALRSELEQIAKNRSGKSVEEIFGFDTKKKKNKTVGEAKYRNPKNTEQTWTGRGKRPRWIQEALDKGGSLDDFLIK